MRRIRCSSGESSWLITVSNLDELSMKRIGGSSSRRRPGMQESTDDGLVAASSRSRRCLVEIRAFEAEQLAHRRRAGRSSWPKWKHRHTRLRLAPSPAEQAVIASTTCWRFPADGCCRRWNRAQLLSVHLESLLKLVVTLRAPDETQPSLAVASQELVALGTPAPGQLDGTRRSAALQDVVVQSLDLLLEGEDRRGRTLCATRNAKHRAGRRTRPMIPLALIETERRDAALRRSSGWRPCGHESVHRGTLAAELGLDEHDDVFVPTWDAGDARSDGADGGSITWCCTIRRTIRRSCASAPSANIFHVIGEAVPILLMHPYESF